jgi:hypothetical protein
MPASVDAAAGTHCCAQVAMVGHADLSHPVDGFGASFGQHGISSATSPGDIPGISAITGAPALMAKAPPNGIDATASKIVKARSRRRMGRRITTSFCHSLCRRGSGDATS